MRRKKDDLDRLTEKLVKQNPSLKEEFKKSDMALDVARQIYDLRKKAGLTQKQLADRMGTSQPHVARIESADYRSYSRKSLEKVAKVLNARVEVRVVPVDSDQTVSILHKIK